MNSTNKKVPGARSVPRPAVQPKVVSGPRVKTHLSTPAPYRPQPRPKNLQAKMARQTPGPPVYRPQPTPRVLQAKQVSTLAAEPPTRGRGTLLVVPVYKPNRVPRVLQRKAAAITTNIAGRLPATTPNHHLLTRVGGAVQLMEDRGGKGGRQGKMRDRPEKHGRSTKRNIEKDSTGRLHSLVYSEEGSKVLHQYKAARGLHGASLDKSELEEVFKGKGKGRTSIVRGEEETTSSDESSDSVDPVEELVGEVQKYVELVVGGQLHGRGLRNVQDKLQQALLELRAEHMDDQRARRCLANVPVNIFWDLLGMTAHEFFRGQ